MRKGLISLLLIVPALLVLIYLFLPSLTLELVSEAELGAAGLERGRVEIDGFRVELLSGGEGEPLVLLHGFGADKSNWVWVARYLTPHFRVIAPDLPGFGDSTRDWKARYAIGDQVERLHDFMRALRLVPAHLGGSSMGGEIAGAYAARYPEDVRSLWLLAPRGVMSAEGSAASALEEKGANPLLVGTHSEFDRLLDLLFFERPRIPGPIKRHLADRAIMDRGFQEKILEDLWEHGGPLEAKLRGLAIPTLLVWGDRDRVLRPSGARVLGSILPNARVVMMENVGHLPMVERPKDVALELLRFHGIDVAAKDQ